MERHCAGGIVLNPKGQIALIRMGNNNWSYPKGHLEEGETALEAALREVREEAGITELKLIKKLGSYKRTHMDNPDIIKKITLFLFMTEQIDLVPEADDSFEAKWVERDDVVKVLHHEEDKSFFLEFAVELEKLI